MKNITACHMTDERILSNWWPAFGGLAKFNPKDS